ncbi:helix-turn-helix transcriptional regulator [Hymenobacter terrenus]|uniref:helix-turn-helix transcriptional regulator n=1 Tax=Hymenobacter terrenus TaxID=1629124 RepID=UPI000697A16B|nr:response regulator transcription factor [Hymenobacter terrenus]
MKVSTPTALVAAAPTLLRQGLVATLREQWPQLLLTITADTTQIVELVAQRNFGLLVLDDALPGRALIGLLDELHQVRPTQRILLLTDQRPSAQPTSPLPWPDTELRLPRYVPPPTLAAVLAPWLDADAPNQARPAVPRAVPDPFSARELQILRLVVDDQCNQEIAERLCLSVRTVESHRRTLLHKAGTRTVVGLAARAVREGWVA